VWFSFLNLTTNILCSVVNWTILKAERYQNRYIFKCTWFIKKTYEKVNGCFTKRYVVVRNVSYAFLYRINYILIDIPNT